MATSAAGAQQLEFVIRTATRADVEGILAVQRAAPESAQWAPAAYAEILTALEFEFKPKQATNHQRAMWCAIRGPQLIGFVVAARISFAEGLECELENMAVHPDHRRTGCGRKLVETMLAWSVQQSAERVLLEVRATNQAALKLYQSLGFHAVGLRKQYYRNPVDDAVLMAFVATPNSFSAE